MARTLKHLFYATLLLVLPALAAEPETDGLEALRTAAGQGQVDAQYELGILYEFGYDFPDHKVAAYAWYSRAAAQGNPVAAKRRDLLQAELGPAELARAQALLQAPPVADAAR